MLSLSSGPAAARPGCAAKPGAALPSSAAAPDCSIARKPGLMAWMELRELQRGLGLGLVFFFFNINSHRYFMLRMTASEEAVGVSCGR